MKINIFRIENTTIYILSNSICRKPWWHIPLKKVAYNYEEYPYRGQDLSQERVKGCINFFLFTGITGEKNLKCSVKAIKYTLETDLVWNISSYLFNPFFCGKLSSFFKLLHRLGFLSIWKKIMKKWEYSLSMECSFNSRPKRAENTHGHHAFENLLYICLVSVGKHTKRGYILLVIFYRYSQFVWKFKLQRKYFNLNPSIN